MESCDHCSGCSGCGDCRAGELELSSGELRLLQELAQFSFLPVARRADSMEPVYLESSEFSKAEYSLIIQCLEKRGLIDLDYRKSLAGADMSAYTGYPVHGSMGLTARGLRVLELLDIQGAE